MECLPLPQDRSTPSPLWLCAPPGALAFGNSVHFPAVLNCVALEEVTVCSEPIPSHRVPEKVIGHLQDNAASVLPVRRGWGRARAPRLPACSLYQPFPRMSWLRGNLFFQLPAVSPCPSITPTKKQRRRLTLSSADVLASPCPLWVTTHHKQLHHDLQL